MSGRRRSTGHENEFPVRGTELDAFTGYNYKNREEFGQKPRGGFRQVQGRIAPQGGLSALVHIQTIYLLRSSVYLVSPPPLQCWRAPIACEGIPGRPVPHHRKRQGKLQPTSDGKLSRNLTGNLPRSKRKILPGRHYSRRERRESIHENVHSSSNESMFQSEWGQAHNEHKLVNLSPHIWRSDNCRSCSGEGGADFPRKQGRREREGRKKEKAEACKSGQGQVGRSACANVATSHPLLPSLPSIRRFICCPPHPSVRYFLNNTL